MTDEQILRWMPYVFPIFFVGMWLLISTLLGVMSGWFNLQQWYADDNSEEPLLKLGWQSGVMGVGVNLNGILTLAAKRSGLSIRIWRIFGPFQKPLLVPWSEISAEPARSFFTQMVKLGLGNPPNGRLKINAATWSKLVAVAGPIAKVPLPPATAVSRKSMALRMFLEWVVITAGAATFFWFAPYFISPPGERVGLPIVICILFPAIVFGLGQLIRYARES
jgi:hypothetical protein